MQHLPSKKLSIQFAMVCFALTMLFLGSCSTRKGQSIAGNPYSLNAYQSHLLDSILQFGLDHEALYTILGNVKPMSSLVAFYYPIANDDSTLKTSGNIINKREQGQYLDEIQTIQGIVNKLNFPDLKFVVVPYQAAQGKTRIIQVSVIRVSALDSLLKAKESFFGQFGLVPGVDPIVVMSVIENADRYERNRGYGYLFGYPDHAVDFFIDATKEFYDTGNFAKRKFFNIPAYAGKEGFFVYANPADYTPTAIDSTIYHRAGEILKEYKQIRPHYLKSDSTVQAYKLLQDFYHQKAIR